MQQPRRHFPFRIFALLLLSGLLPVLLGVMGGCSSSGKDAKKDGEIVVWVSGDTRGYLEPCGCRRDQAGGLPARMTLLQQDTSPHQLLVDVGNLTSGGRSYELLKLDFLLRGMATLHYDALNLGKREVNLDRDTLLTKIRNSHLPFVSCNVLDRQTGKSLTSPSLLLTVDGTRIGITGVVKVEAEDVGPGLTVRAPEEALAEVLPELKSRCDFVVVLAFAPSETLHSLANRFPEVGLLLGGEVPQSSEQAETVNRSVVFSVTGKGKVLGRLAFRRTENGLTLTQSRALKTSDTLPPASAMTSLLTEYRTALRNRNVELGKEEGLDPISTETTTADLYASQAKCQHCHASAHKITLTTAHTHAYETLVAKKSEYDPECLRCHTVGYGAKDGFLNLQKTPSLAGVQCESCHGRGTLHLQAVRAGKQGRSALETLRVVTPQSCVRCHDAENSAAFSYATFWPKIQHTKDP